MQSLKLLVLGVAMIASNAAHAQVRLTPIERTGAADGPSSNGTQAAAAAPCKAKKKGGFGLGGILKAAKNSGLGSLVGSRVGDGLGGAIAATAANTAVDAVAAAEKSAVNSAKC